MSDTIIVDLNGLAFNDEDRKQLADEIKRAIVNIVQRRAHVAPPVAILSKPGWWVGKET